MVFHQLSVILVGCDHVHLETLPGSLFGQGADHVVRLIGFRGDDGYVECLDDLLDVGQCDADILRLGFAVGLVLRKIAMPERRSLQVKGHGDVAGLFVVDNVPEIARESGNGGGI